MGEKNYVVKLHYAQRAKELGNINDFVKELRLEYPDIGAEKAEKIYSVLSDHRKYHITENITSNRRT